MIYLLKNKKISQIDRYMWEEREKIEKQYNDYKISQREAKELLCKNHEKWYYSYEKELDDKEFYIIFEF